MTGIRVASAPTPAIKDARQFFDAKGREQFVCEAYGRRPDVQDALRVLGIGANRVEAIVRAEKNWKAAWRSLHPTVKLQAKAPRT